MPPRSSRQEAQVKAAHALCDELRRRGGVPWRSAVVEEERKEFFRGKDLLRWFQKHPDKLTGVAGSSTSVEAGVQDFCTLLLDERIIIACERFYKRAHPGRKHLVKFPRRLEPYSQREQSWNPEAFYCWLDDRPMPPWQIALSVMMAIAILAVCLFPLAPYWLRLSVVYFFLGLLGIIFALIIIRFVAFMIVFAASGYEFWLFPNLLSDQVDILGAFVPATSFGKPVDGKSHWGSRIGGVAGSAAMFYVLYVYAPDEKTVIKDVRGMGDSILDMFQNVQNPSLGAGTGYVPPKFGADRNIDPEQIRQKMFAEKQRQREERRKARAAGGAAREDAGSGGQTGSDSDDGAFQAGGRDKPEHADEHDSGAYDDSEAGGVEGTREGGGGSVSGETQQGSSQGVDGPAGSTADRTEL